MALKMLALGVAMILNFQSPTLAQTTIESDTLLPSTTTGTSGSTLTTTTATATPLMCRDKTLFAVPGQDGYLSSSNYTFNNNDFIACWWTINSTSGYVVKTTILNATSPFFFFFEIRDGMWESSPIIDRIGRVASPTVYYSSGRSMYIMFVDSNHSPNTSFSLTYVAINESFVSTSEATPTSTLPPTSGPTLAQTTRESDTLLPSTTTGTSGSTLTTTTEAATPLVCRDKTLFAVPGQVGYLSSSNYTFNNNDFIACWWTINSTSGYVVKTTILNATSPFFFFFEIRDGMWESSPIIDRIGKVASPTAYYSSGRSMYIMFVDSNHSPNTSFSLTYEAIDESLVSTSEATPTSTLPPTSECPLNGTTLSALPGQVEYLRFPNHPSNYSNNTDCRWIINSVNGSVVKVTVLEASSDSFYHIDIFDGMSESSPTLVKFYGMPPQTVYYSSGQYMYIRFTGNGSVTTSGLRLTYEAVNPPFLAKSDACTCTCSCVPTCVRP